MCHNIWGIRVVHWFCEGLNFSMEVEDFGSNYEMYTV
jgi:hypothetical protein